MKWQPIETAPTAGTRILLRGMNEDSRMDELNLPKIISTTEAAKALGVHPQTLRKWAKEGYAHLQPVYIGGRIMWRVEDIRKLLGGES